MLVSSRMPVQRGREGIDERARRIVLDAYRESCRTGSQKPFDAALDRYLKRYPHVSKDLAGHAVAHILTTEGV